MFSEFDMAILDTIKYKLYEIDSLYLSNFFINCKLPQFAHSLSVKQFFFFIFYAEATYFSHITAVN